MEAMGSRYLVKMGMLLRESSGKLWFKPVLLLLLFFLLSSVSVFSLPTELLVVPFPGRGGNGTGKGSG